MTNQTNIHGDQIHGDKVGGDKIAGDKNVYNNYYNNEPPPFPLSNLPPYNPNFVGREELLATIYDTFRQGDGSIAITQAIAGLGGVGKTQLALAYAHQHKADYDLIWQLPADEPAPLDDALRQLGAALHLRLQNVDAPTARQMVLGWLNGRHQRWLLLYDNADKLPARDLQAYLPSGGGHVLITSRQPNWAKAQVLKVDVFAPAEAAAFWAQRMEDGDGPVDPHIATNRETLAETLGYLPLALEHAAAYMTVRNKSAADYLALFQERREALWARTAPPDDYHATITTTWEMAFAHAKSTPGAADLLNLCCFFAPDDIPLAMIQTYVDELPDALAAVVKDELMLDDALEALQAYSLLTQQDGMLAIHRMVQTVALDQMPQELIETWATAAVKLLAEAYPYDKNDMTTWDLSGHLLPHVVAAVELAERLEPMPERISYLWNETGLFLLNLADYPNTYHHLKRALAIDEKALGADHPTVAIRLNNLGQLLKAVGDYEGSRPFMERALAISEKALGADHPSVAIRLNNLGGLLQAVGDYEGARPLMERALAIDENALGADHPDVARDLNNLGGLLKAVGDYEGARPLYERALAIDEKALGANHPTVAIRLNNLGNLLKAVGDYEGARPLMERALAIWEKALGADHPDVALGNNNLGQLAESGGGLRGGTAVI